MLSESDIPSTARCLSCGYLLRGLPTPVCPECGRAFDPTDASTYDLRPPHWRRRVWMRRGLVAFIISVALAIFAPRNLLRGQLTLTCQVCGEMHTTHRWELLPPRWIPFRYPGFDRTTVGPPAPDVVPPCTSHAYRVIVRFDMHNGGQVSGTGGSVTARNLTLNGLVTTVETAPEVLEHLMHPLNNGIQVGPSLVP